MEVNNPSFLKAWRYRPDQKPLKHAKSGEGLHSWSPSAKRDLIALKACVSISLPDLATDFM